LDAHFASARSFKLNRALFGRRDQFDECRLGRLAPDDGNSIQSFLQTRIVKPQRVSDGIYTVLSSQFDRCLPQRLRSFVRRGWVLRN